jgi:hypothetical protein
MSSQDAQQSFPVTIEKAWHNLMTTIGVKNQEAARQQQIAIRGILQVMRRR